MHELEVVGGQKQGFEAFRTLGSQEEVFSKGQQPTGRASDKLLGSKVNCCLLYDTIDREYC